MTDGELLPVMQADRDRAADWMRLTLKNGRFEFVNRGEYDHKPEVQMFAAHRIEAEQRASKTHEARGMTGGGVEIEQGDRQLYIDYVTAMAGSPPPPDRAADILSGKTDDHPGVVLVAFARHRFASTRLAPEVGVEGVREALNERDAAAGVCPFVKGNPPKNAELCPVCNGDSSEPCRKRVIADGEMVDAVRSRLAALPADRSWREALEASLAKRSQPTMDPLYTAAFNAALDMVARDMAAFLLPSGVGERG